MSEITLSKAVRSNLLNLQSTANLLSKSQERLSSGLRVNSALDNPTNFFTAQGLNSRASDLSQLADAVSNAVQTVAAADKGITAITKLVESAQATARQALQTAATVPGDDVAATITGTDTTLADADIAALDGETLSISVNGGTAQTITFATGALDTLAELQTALQGINGATGTAAAGGVTITADNNTDTLQLSFSDPSVGTALGLTTTLASPTAGADVANPKRAELVGTYNDLLGQIDALAKDSGFNGVNLLNGDNLSVIFNEDGSSKIDIQGVDNTTGVSGLNLASLATTAFDTNSGVNGVLDDLKGVIDTLRSQSAKFGSSLSVVETRQDFTKQMINVLQTGAANLTLADTNEEAANVLALQTRQQLSSTALSLASQADQNVLRLF